MPKRELVTEADLAALAKKFRIAAKKNRSEAAREFGVSRPSLIHAEDFPEKSFTKLRIRIIERYSPFQVSGPVFLLKKKASGVLAA
jgi:DNA-binding XRE family transcriptional regulator